MTTMMMPTTTADTLTFAQLRTASAARQVEWLLEATETPSLSFRGNELAGEVGELCNLIKKLDRERMNIRGSRAQLSDVADEAADVVLCVELVCADLGIDLGAALRKKFNETSAKYELATTMEGANRQRRVIGCHRSDTCHKSGCDHNVYADDEPTLAAKLVELRLWQASASEQDLAAQLVELRGWQANAVASIQRHLAEASAEDPALVALVRSGSGV